MSSAARARRVALAPVLALVAALAAAVSIIIAAAPSSAAATGGATREAERAGVGPVLHAADAALHPIREGLLRMKSIVTRAGVEPAISRVDVYVKGPDHVLCVFREGPLADRKILTVGDRTWLVVPGSERAIPVSAGQRLLGGASIADVARLQFETGFDGAARPDDEQLDGVACRVLDLRARSRKSAYATAVLWVGREDGLPRKALLALASGTIAKEVRFTAYRRLPSGPALERMLIRHLLPSEQGMETDLELLDVETRALDAALFTPAGARGVS